MKLNFVLDALGGVSAGAVASSGLVATLLTSQATAPYVGAGVPVIIGSALGAVAGIALSEPISPRSKLFKHGFAYTVLGAASATFIPMLMGWKLEPAQAGALAVISAAAMRKLWPALTENFSVWFATINPFKRK